MVEKKALMGYVRWFVAELLAPQDGATAVEYGVMLALVLLVAVAAVSTFGASLGGKMTNIATTISGS